MENHNAHTEKVLFALIAEGNEAALDELYELLRPRMEGYVLKLMKTEAAVMDVLQESLIRLWLNRDKLPSVEYPVSWFFRIIANECFRCMRRQISSKDLIKELSYSFQNETSRNAEQELSYRETQRIIQETVLSLPARNREVYRLSREEGLKMQEIADKTGLSFQYVKKVLVNTLRIIRQKLREAGKYTAALLFSIFF